MEKIWLLIILLTGIISGIIATITSGPIQIATVVVALVCGIVIIVWMVLRFVAWFLFGRKTENRP